MALSDVVQQLADTLRGKLGNQAPTGEASAGKTLTPADHPTTIPGPELLSALFDVMQNAQVRGHKDRETRASGRALEAMLRDHLHLEQTRLDVCYGEVFVNGQPPPYPDDTLTRARLVRSWLQRANFRLVVLPHRATSDELISFAVEVFRRHSNPEERLSDLEIGAIKAVASRLQHHRVEQDAPADVRLYSEVRDWCRALVLDRESAEFDFYRGPRLAMLISEEYRRSGGAGLQLLCAWRDWRYAWSDEELASALFIDTIMFANHCGLNNTDVSVAAITAVVNVLIQGDDVVARLPDLLRIGGLADLGPSVGLDALELAQEQLNHLSARPQLVHTVSSFWKAFSGSQSKPLSASDA
ncbi:MAG: hypothetical protein KC561_17850, partial [Myxococcales bacterium]|nr:hypothetical protein [Myxococcales bacterium]